MHQALLAGLLSHIGLRRDPDRRDPEDRGEYLGARGARFAVFPGSALFKKHAAVRDGRRAGRDLPAVGAE